jgi:transaldolase
VSVWLDQLGRGLLTGGELKRRITEDSLRGVTSNPSIFEKSILGSNDYDEDIQKLAHEGKSALEIYNELVIADVQAAADTLAGVHAETGGVDGFVSLEVQPHATTGRPSTGRT